MGFLDNSGDIILDAVLTDTGRMRLAKGDGSFRITKFALADDEIDYSLFDRNNVSGSAYFDLEILQTPVLEAFTNNGSSMKNKLITITRNNLLFLPVLKLNNLPLSSQTAISQLVNNGYMLAVDLDTQTYLDSSTLKYQGEFINKKGLLYGVNPASTTGGSQIRIDQGIDSTKVPALSNALDPDLFETQYIIEMDNRLMSLINVAGDNSPTPSYIDDDDIASYYLSQDLNNPTDPFVNNNTAVRDSTTGADQPNQVIAGARGTILQFKLRSSLETSTSDYLFNQFGTTLVTNSSAGFEGGSTTSSTIIKSILTNINVTGVTTGFGIDIPIRLIKKIA